MIPDSGLLNLCAHIVLAALLAWVLFRVHMPAGILVGVFVAFACVNCAFEPLSLPDTLRVVIQILAGSCVGCSLTQRDLVHIPHLVKPLTIMLTSCFAIMLIGAVCISALTKCDMLTALMCAVPGGINDTPVVAIDMGADGITVTILQLVRQIVGVAVFPAVIHVLDEKSNARAQVSGERDGAFPAYTQNACTRAQTAHRKRQFEQHALRGTSHATTHSTATKPPVGAKVLHRLTAYLPALLRPHDEQEIGSSEHAHKSTTQKPRDARLLCTRTLAALVVAGICGLAGYATHIPGMIFTLVVTGVLTLKLGANFAYSPRSIKRLVQVLSGAYLGSLITPDKLLCLLELVLPALVIVALYTLNCFITGAVHKRLCGYTSAEGRMMSIPAGASDMILILDDMRIQNNDIVIVHAVRAAAVAALFPQLVNLLCYGARAIGL